MNHNFENMSISELRSYVLAHREDDEAFYQLADRLEQDSADEPLYPFPDTSEAIAIMEQAIRDRVERLKDS